MFNIIYISWRH